MAKFTKAEQETIINMDRSAKTATLYTRDAHMQAKMKTLRIKPAEDDGAGGKTYILPSKKMVQIRAYAKPDMTDEQRQEIAERLAAGKAAKTKAAAKTAKKVVPTKVTKKAPVVEEEEVEEEPAPVKKTVKKVAAPAAKGKPAAKKPAKEEEEVDELDDSDD